MLARIARFCNGVWALRENNRQYFVRGHSGGPSQFRNDVRAFMGGFLAVAFITSALSNLAHVSVASTDILTIAAGAIGGIAGKYWFVS
jgi:hypothetical protein